MSSGSQKTIILNYELDGSMDQRTHVRQVAAPQVIRATNVRYPDIGAVEKRQGIASITNSFSTAGGQPGGTMTNGNGKLMTCRDELLVTDGFKVGSLAVHASPNVLVDKGKIPEMTSTYIPVDTTQYTVSQPDVAVTSQGLVFHVWAANDRSSSSDMIPRYDVFWTVQDRTSGAEIISQGSTAGGADAWQPHIVAAGTNVLLFWVQSGTGNIVVRPWDPTNLTWSAASTIVTDGETDYGGPYYRVCTDGTNVYLAYNQTNVAVRVLRLNPATGAVTASITSTETLPLHALGIGICATAADDRVWVTYARDLPTTQVDIRASAYNLALSSQITAPTTIYAPVYANGYAQTSVTRVTSTSAIVQVWVHGSNPGTADGRNDFTAYPVINNSAAIIGAATGDQRRTYWGIPASPPFVMSTSPLRVFAWHMAGGAYLGTLPPSPSEQQLQWTMTLIDCYEPDTTEDEWRPRPITWEAPRYSLPDYLGNINGFANGVNPFVPASIVLAPTGEWVTSSIIRRNAGTRVGLIEVRAKSKGPELWCNAEMGGTMIVGPGHYWDRRQMAEISYVYWPQKPAATPSATGGFLKNSEKYLYRVLYEYVDGTGAVHRSQASDILEVNTPAGAGTAASVSLTVPALSHTARQDAIFLNQGSGVRIVVYRSGPYNTPVDDLAFYRVFSDTATPKNRTTLNVITFTDTAADFDYSGLASRKKQLDTLYQEGGILPNTMPNAFTACVAYRNRFFVAYRNNIAYTKQFVPGEAPSFSDLLTFPCEETGNITSLFKMDDALYIATRDRIYSIAGDGPNDAGTQNDIGTPSLVVTDRGVVDQRSVVTMPLGTMFQSTVGIQMLERGRAVNVEPIGSRVQDDLVTFSEITSACMHPTGGYVTFCARVPQIGGGGTYDGIRLVYDYTTNRWSRDTLMLNNPDVGRGILSEAESRGRIYLLFANGINNHLALESLTDWRDEGSWVPMQIQLSEVHPQGLQGHYGFKKWSLNAARYSGFNIVLSWFRNYEASAYDTSTIISDDVMAAPVDLPFSEDTTIHLAKSARLVIQDAFPSNPAHELMGRGGAFVGLALEVDQITGKIYPNAAQEKS